MNSTPSKSYSIAAVAQRKIDIFRTNEQNPLKHNPSQSAQFYKIDPEVRKQLFQHGGIPKSFDIQTKTFAETCLMIREPALDVINCMNRIDYSKPPVKFVLYGDKGVGKSLTLAHLIHHAYESGHFIVHVPWVGQWMRSCKEYSNSESKEGYVDLNIDAAAWLHHIKVQNAHFLSKPEFVTSQTYQWSKREATEKGASLVELIDHGINRIKYACDTITALAEEIKVLSKSGVCKTFVAIDGYNAFFYPYTRVFTEKKERVAPAKITITEGFLNLTKTDWNNAVCVLTVDEIAIAEEDHKSPLPRYLLGKEGFEHLDPFVPIPVTSYNPKEFVSCMEYYRERKWVQPVAGMDEELAFISGSNPYKLMNLCAPL